MHLTLDRRSVCDSYRGLGADTGLRCSALTMMSVQCHAMELFSYDHQVAVGTQVVADHFLEFLEEVRFVLVR